MIRIVGIGLLVLAILYGGARFFIPRVSSDTVATGPLERDGLRTLADCPGSPNCAGSEASDPERRVERLVVPGGIDAVARWIEAESDASVVTRDADYLHATFRSRVMGYTDDVEFLALPGGDEVAVRSASRLGRSDLGANRKRIERIRVAIATSGT